MDILPYDIIAYFLLSIIVVSSMGKISKPAKLKHIYSKKQKIMSIILLFVLVNITVFTYQEFELAMLKLFIFLMILIVIQTFNRKSYE